MSTLTRIATVRQNSPRCVDYRDAAGQLIETAGQLAEVAS
jgi:hypothetical protein